MQSGQTSGEPVNKSFFHVVRQRLAPISFSGALNSVLLVVPVVALIIQGYRQRWMSEDAYISLRVVQQILAGNGPVFNLGERVEAQTNPLWVAIIATIGWAGADIVQTALWLGIVLSAVGMAAGLLASSQLQLLGALQPDDRARSLLIPAGAIAFIAVPVTWDFLTSGLETGLGFGWLGVSFWVLVQLSAGGRDAPAWRWYAAGFFLALGPLIRPDFAIFSVGFLGSLLLLRHWSRDTRMRVADVALIGLAAGALPVAYQIFRMGYYAALVPNTAIAKEAGESNWGQGEIYLRDFVDPYMLWIPVGIVLGLWALRLVGWVRQRHWPQALIWAVPVLTGAVHALYVVRVGGDFMHGRLLLPAFFAILLPLAVVRVPLDLKPRTFAISATVIALLVWSSVAAFSLRTSLGSDLDEESGLVDERAYYVERSEHENPVTTDDYLTGGYRGAERGQKAREMAESGPPTILISDNEFPASQRLPDEIRAVIPDVNIGVLSYIAGLPVHTVDRLGLAEPIGSRLELEERDRPGHEKMLPMAWVSARFTGLEPEDVSDPEFGLARAALECGELAELDEAVTDPLTFDRFMENVQRSWSFYTLRIPNDPEEARAKFCAE